MSQYYLIVEDNPIDMLVTKSLVESEGAVPICSNDGLSALEVLNDQEEDAVEISLVIVDLNMPHMSGLNLIRRIRRIGKYQKIPILVTSARKEIEEVHSATRAGATDYLVKPLDPLLFQEKIGFLGGNKQSWAEYEIPETDKMNTAHMLTNTKFLSISEVGATLESEKEIKPNKKFGLISKMLLDANVGQLICKVEECRRSPGDVFKIKVRFIGVTESKRKHIRLLCRKLWNFKNNENSDAEAS